MQTAKQHTIESIKASIQTPAVPRRRRNPGISGGKAFHVDLRPGAKMPHPEIFASSRFQAWVLLA